MEIKGFFQFEIIINVLVSSFCFTMLWVYGHNKCFYFFQCGDRLHTSESDVYRRQILTYKDGPRTERVYFRTSQNTAPELAFEILYLGTL